MILLDETLRQVFYKAMKDSDFGKNVFYSLPLSEDYFGEEVDLAKYIQKFYYNHNSDISGHSLKLLIEKDLENTHHLTEEVRNDWEVKINDVVDIEDNFSNNQDINDLVDSWSRKKLFYKSITETVSNHDISKSDVINGLITKLENINSLTKKSNITDLDVFNTETLENTISEISDSFSEPVPTGFRDLDNALYTGLRAKEAGMVVASTGAGKTTTLLNLASNYLINKFPVVFLELEEDMGQLILKSLSNLVNMSRSNFFDSSNSIDVNTLSKILSLVDKAYSEKRLGKFNLWNAESYTVTIEDIENRLKDYFDNLGYYPKVLIIDYPDLMLNNFENSNLQSNVATERMFHKLRDLAKKYGIILWVASQANRSGYLSQDITLYSIEGSKAKTNSMDLIVSVNATSKEYDEGFTRLKILKARNRSDHFPSDSYVKLKVDKSSVRYLDESPEEEEEHQKLLDELGTALNTSPKTNKKMDYQITDGEIQNLRDRIE